MTDLFDHAAQGQARRTDPQESRDAAARVNVSADEAMVIEALTQYGPMTTAEVAEITKRDREKISPRFAPLARREIIERTGERRDGSAVWRVR